MEIFIWCLLIFSTFWFIKKFGFLQLIFLLIFCVLIYLCTTELGIILIPIMLVTVVFTIMKIFTDNLLLLTFIYTPVTLFVVGFIYGIVS